MGEAPIYKGKRRVIEHYKGSGGVQLDPTGTVGVAMVAPGPRPFTGLQDATAVPEGTVARLGVRLRRRLWGARRSPRRSAARSRCRSLTPNLATVPGLDR